MSENICQIVRDAEDNYVRGTTSISEHVDWGMHDTIETIDAYLNSKHISGAVDSLGREKPFFNIVTAAVNIWTRATDLDRKNIRILPPSVHDTGMAFVATVLLHDWMRKSRFGVFLNDWGRALARYGSAVVKFVEKEGELVASVIPWNRLVVDPIDFDALPCIEKLYFTPAQLRKNKQYDPQVVKDLLEGQTTRKDLEGDQRDTYSKFIEVYEVHGELPLSLLTDNENDEETYVQQMHVVSFVQNEDGDYDDYTLYRGRERKNPYMITHLMKEDGRTLSIGAVEYLFDAQWMQNHTIKNVKDTLDLASKLIFQTSDPKYVGRNVFSSIETGDIFIHQQNMPLTQINNSKADVSAFLDFGQQWQAMAREITSTPEALRGETLPSGTPYSLGAYLGSQANSLFELFTENKGLHIEDMMREYVIPHIMKKMDTKDEVVAILDDHEITEIDSMFIPREAIRRYNTEAKRQLIEGEIPSPYQQDVAESQVRQDMAALGNKRFFKPSELEGKTWKKALEGFEMRAVVEVTNEQSDKQAVLTTLSTVLQTIATNPLVLQDQNARMILNAILTETGRISPLQLTTASASSAAPPTGGAEALQDLANTNGATQ